MEDATVIKKNYLEKIYFHSCKNTGCICTKDFVLIIKCYWSCLIGSGSFDSSKNIIFLLFMNLRCFANIER